MRRDTTRWQRKLVAVSQAKSRVRSTRNRKLWMCDMREYENHRRFVDSLILLWLRVVRFGCRFVYRRRRRR